MNLQILAPLPSILHDIGFTEIHNLLDHVQFTHTIKHLLVVNAFLQVGLVDVLHILNIEQPVIDQPQALLFNGSHHATTTIVTTHNHMFDFQVFNGKLHHRKAVHISVHHHIGDIAVDKHLSR